jgi:TonB family protein
MKPFLLLICFLGIILQANAQTLPTEISKDSIFYVVDERATFQGDSLDSYLQNNLRYPYASVCGKFSVYVHFVIRKDGVITNVTITRGIKGFPKFDEEALRVINNMPRWNPAKRNGKAVDCYCMLPIRWL